jgi:GH3 auxin-responsive promoter
MCNIVKGVWQPFPIAYKRASRTLNHHLTEYILIDICLPSCLAMNGKKLEFKGEEALRDLERLTINAREVQATILTDILSRNRETEYFRIHMKGAKDISEFKARVPIVTYKHILPYIERISNGEDSSIISGHPIIELLRRSNFLLSSSKVASICCYFTSLFPSFVLFRLIG